MQLPDPISPAAITETVVGGFLASTPLWMRYLIEFNLIVATITGILGLIIAAVGVWRIANRIPPQ